jgi:hypothetical protein
MNNNSPNGISAIDKAILNRAAVVGNGINYVKNTISNNANTINWLIIIILFGFVIFL